MNFDLNNYIFHTLSVGFIFHNDLLKTFVFLSFSLVFYMDIHNLFSEWFEGKVYTACSFSPKYFPMCSLRLGTFSDTITGELSTSQIYIATVIVSPLPRRIYFEIYFTK